MFYTYVLLCEDGHKGRKSLYTGYTSDLRERLKVHKSKSVESTKEFNSITLIYYEACLNKKDARKRELQLKTGFGRGYLNRRLEEYLKSV